MTYCQLNLKEKTQGNLNQIILIFYSRKCIWRHHLQNVYHFVQVSMCSVSTGETMLFVFNLVTWHDRLEAVSYFCGISPHAKAGLLKGKNRFPRGMRQYGLDISNPMIRYKIQGYWPLWSLGYLRCDVWMAQCKTAVTPLLMHWSYCSLALSHLCVLQQQYIINSAVTDSPGIT